MAPRWPQDGPKMAPSRPRWPQDGPKNAPRLPKTAPRTAKMTPNRPRWPQDDPKMTPGWLKMRKMTLKMRLKTGKIPFLRDVPSVFTILHKPVLAWEREAR